MSYTVQTNHNNIELNIHKMVFNRIAFLPQTQNNADLISNFIVEVCHEIESCFRISWYNDAGVEQSTQDKTRIADESKYNNKQKSLIADIVSVWLLRRIAGLGSSNFELDVSTGDLIKKEDKYLSGVKAGSVEVSYDQVDSKKGDSIQLKAETLIDQYEKSAFKKGLNVGCVLDICKECADKYLENDGLGIPFINIQT